MALDDLGVDDEAGADVVYKSLERGSSFSEADTKHILSRMRQASAVR